MAMRWRIRHKLTVGLLLVVGIMALLLLGTLKGLLSYRATMKTIDSKLAELKTAQSLQHAVSELTLACEGKTNQPHNLEDLRHRIAASQEALKHYRNQLCETLARGRDLDKGNEELKRVNLLENYLDKLAQQAMQTPVPSMTSAQEDLRLDPKPVSTNVSELLQVIYTDLHRRIPRAKADYRMSLYLVGVTCVLGVVFLMVLAQLAYRWVVHPIRDLHEKVSRLAEGNFDSRIEVQSGDEMQDLAEAFNDMTERLQDIYRDLARQVNERSRQLVRSERLAGIGFLAAGVAHEINNPLASIAFCSESLQRRLLDLVADRPQHPDVVTVTNYLSMIQQEAFRCKDITQKLLEFSRVGERRRQLTDLAQLIRGVLDMVLHLQSYKGKHILFEPREQPQVWVNAPEIKSVILNLVVNALDSMDEGGRLEIGLDTSAGMTVMTFTDTGCGMTPEVLENIFEPFFTRSRTGKGTGLGLSISHRVVTQHGGEIEASSPGPDQGSTFTVRLPLTPALPQEAEPVRRAA